MTKRRDCWSAGHGMGSRHAGQKDPGAVSKYGIEADAARTLALRMAHNSAAMNVKTLFRDRGPYYLADNEAHAFQATRFREIHFDAGPSTASGVTVLVGPKAGLFEIRMAKLSGIAIADVLDIDFRGIKVRDDLAVLHQYPDMASCLIEVGFITSKLDMSRYHSRELAVELALVNVDRALDKAPPLKKVPRLTWRKYRIKKNLRTV